MKTADEQPQWEDTPHSHAVGANTPEPSWVGFGGPDEFVLQIFLDGRTLWRGREIDSDEDFRAAMMDVHQFLTRLHGGAR